MQKTKSANDKKRGGGVRRVYDNKGKWQKVQMTKSAKYKKCKWEKYKWQKLQITGWITKRARCPKIRSWHVNRKTESANDKKYVKYKKCKTQKVQIRKVQWQ